MTAPLRLRYPTAIDRYLPYAPFLAWPVIFTVPYGAWTWAIAFAPDVFVWLYRKAERARAPFLVEPRRTASGTELVRDGRVVDSFADADVETVTVACSAKTVLRTVRVARRSGRDLLFEAESRNDSESVAQRLGLDLGSARSRYRTLSRVTRFGILFFVGIALLAWSMWGHPDRETAHWVALYTRYVWLPFIVILAVPTWVDVGRDGVAWRWLFTKGYVPFASVDTIKQVGRAFDLVETSGRKTRVWPSKDSVDIGRHLAEAFAASRQAPKPTVDDAPLVRGEGERALAWVRRMRALASSAGAYRGASMTHLWAVAEDDAAPLEKRVAALLVLCDGDAARARGRVVAARIVDPSRRALVEAIAAGEDDERVASLV